MNTPRFFALKSSIYEGECEARFEIKTITLQNIIDWRDIGVELIPLLQAGGVPPDNVEKFRKRVDQSDVYAYATFLKWESAWKVSRTCSDLREFEEKWSGKDEYFAVLSAQLDYPESWKKTVGLRPAYAVPSALLLLRCGWDKSLILEYLVVRSDVRKVFGLDLVPALLLCAAEIAELVKAPLVWTETGEHTAESLWAKYLKKSVGEIYGASATHFLEQCKKAIE